MKTSFLLTITLLFILEGTAQPTQQYYDYQWQPVPVEKALYYATTFQYGKLYYRNNYYIREDKLQMEGFYTDAACKIKQGTFYTYYPNGFPETACVYDKNILQGIYYSYYENGVMRDSVYYNKGSVVGNAFSWHRDGMLKDSSNRNIDGSGVAVSWHSNGQPASAGFFAAGGGLRGTWQYFHFNGNPASREKYENGVVVDKRYFDEEGKPETDTTNTDRPAGFPGGDAEWRKYLAGIAIIPNGWDDLRAGDITVVVKGVIDREGKLNHVFVAAPFHPAFDQLALKAVMASPQWLPAIEHHRTVETPVILPISFVRDR